MIPLPSRMGNDNASNLTKYVQNSATNNENGYFKHVDSLSKVVSLGKSGDLEGAAAMLKGMGLTEQAEKVRSGCGFSFTGNWLKKGCDFRGDISSGIYCDTDTAEVPKNQPITENPVTQTTEQMSQTNDNNDVKTNSVPEENNSSTVTSFQTDSPENISSQITPDVSNTTQPTEQVQTTTASVSSQQTPNVGASQSIDIPAEAARDSDLRMSINNFMAILRKEGLSQLEVTNNNGNDIARFSHPDKPSQFYEVEYNGKARPGAGKRFSVSPECLDGVLKTNFIGKDIYNLINTPSAWTSSGELKDPDRMILVKQFREGDNAGVYKPVKYSGLLKPPADNKTESVSKPSEVTSEKPVQPVEKVLNESKIQDLCLTSPYQLTLPFIPEIIPEEHLNKPLSQAYETLPTSQKLLISNLVGLLGQDPSLPSLPFKDDYKGQDIQTADSQGVLYYNTKNPAHAIMVKAPKDQDPNKPGPINFSISPNLMAHLTQQNPALKVLFDPTAWTPSGELKNPQRFNPVIQPTLSSFNNMIEKSKQREQDHLPFTEESLRGMLKLPPGAVIRRDGENSFTVNP